MTQANTFYHLTEELQNNDGSVVKRVILFGNNAYLWSTENGYELFVEQALTINEENYQEINKLLETYGTDRWTTDAINSLERSKNSTERSLGYLDIAKSARNRFSNRQNNRYGKTSDGTGVNGNPVADTESQKDGIATFTTPKGEIYNSELEKQEITAIQDHIETLPNDTDTSRGLYFYNKVTKHVYKFNTSLYQYKDNRAEGRDGFEILGKADASTLSEEQLKEIGDGFKENKTGFDSWLKRAGYEKRTSDSGDVLIKNGETVDNHDGLGSHSLSGKSNRGQSDRSGRGNKGASEIATFTTPKGEIYGFVDKAGNIYLDETVISPEHPIHEYTHLWDRAVQQKRVS